MTTTIQIENNLKEKLDSLKVHHRETYNELIVRLIEGCSPNSADRESLIETIDVLSDAETMRDIAEALEEINAGKRGKPLSEIKKESGL